MICFPSSPNVSRDEVPIGIYLNLIRTRDQESTNQNARSAEWKSRYITTPFDWRQLLLKLLVWKRTCFWFMEEIILRSLSTKKTTLPQATPVSSILQLFISQLLIPSLFLFLCYCWHIEGTQTVRQDHENIDPLKRHVFLPRHPPIQRSSSQEVLEVGVSTETATVGASTADIPTSTPITTETQTRNRDLEPKGNPLS